jgi:Zn-dependent protease
VTFRLLGFPITVRASFWLIVAVLSLPYLGEPGRMAIWPIVVFSGVLLHELGHALAARAFGHEASIELMAMGGVTSWRPDPERMPAWWQLLIISAAGPLTGIAVGFGVAVAALFAGAVRPEALLTLGGPGDASLLEHAVAAAVWVNAGWGALNLLPIYPLDGGQIGAALIDGALPGRGRLWAMRLTVLFGGGAALLALRAGWLWSAVIAGYLAFRALRDMGAEAAIAPDRAVLPRLLAARQAFDRGELERARRLAEAARSEARTDLVRGGALELLARVAVAHGEHARAAELLAALPQGLEPDPLLAGVVDLANGHLAHAVASLSEAVAREPSSENRVLLARALALDGNLERALDQLERAAEIGGPSRADLLGEPAFAPLRSHPRFEALVARLP